MIRKLAPIREDVLKEKITEISSLCAQLSLPCMKGCEV